MRFKPKQALWLQGVFEHRGPSPSRTSSPVRNALFNVRLCTPPDGCLQPSVGPLPKVVKEIAVTLSNKFDQGSIPTVFKGTYVSFCPRSLAPMVSNWNVPLVAILGFSNYVSHTLLRSAASKTGRQWSFTVSPLRQGVAQDCKAVGSRLGTSRKHHINA